MGGHLDMALLSSAALLFLGPLREICFSRHLSPQKWVDEQKRSSFLEKVSILKNGGLRNGGALKQLLLLLPGKMALLLRTVFQNTAHLAQRWWHFSPQFEHFWGSQHTIKICQTILSTPPCLQVEISKY